MEKKKITPEELISKGYKEFEDNRIFDSMCTKRFFQKRITDNKGVRYFINFERIEYILIPSIRVMWSVNFQFTPKGYDTIQVELVQWFNEGRFCTENGNTIEKAEELCEKIFDRMEGVYYE